MAVLRRRCRVGRLVRSLLLRMDPIFGPRAGGMLSHLTQHCFCPRTVFLRLAWLMRPARASRVSPCFGSAQGALFLAIPETSGWLVSHGVADCVAHAATERAKRASQHSGDVQRADSGFLLQVQTTRHALIMISPTFVPIAHCALTVTLTVSRV
jgi:hypothetical protein